MELAKWLLVVLGSLPPAYADREESGRDARMETIADAVAEVAERASCSGQYEMVGCVRIWDGEAKELAALLVTKAWWESRLLRRVHENKCKRNECDAAVVGGTVVHKARSIWQLQRTSYSAPEWDTMVGTSYVATRAAAWAAAKVLSEGRKRCGPSSFGVLSWYGRQRCSWAPAMDRDRTYKRLMKLEGTDG